MSKHFDGFLKLFAFQTKIFCPFTLCLMRATCLASDIPVGFIYPNNDTVCMYVWSMLLVCLCFTNVPVLRMSLFYECPCYTYVKMYKSF